MVASGQLLALRQELVEMSPPAGRVLAAALALGLRSIQHILNASPKPLGSLRDAFPQGLEDIENILGRDLIYRMIADRFGVGLEGHGPLGRVLGVTPRGLHGLDISIGALAKSWNLLFGTGGLWVFSTRQHRAQSRRLGARSSKEQIAAATQSQLPHDARDGHT